MAKGFIKGVKSELKKVDMIIINCIYLKKYYENEDIMQEGKYIFDRNSIDINDKKKTLDYLISNNLYIII